MRFANRESLLGRVDALPAWYVLPKCVPTRLCDAILSSSSFRSHRALFANALNRETAMASGRFAGFFTT